MSSRVHPRRAARSVRRASLLVLCSLLALAVTRAGEQPPEPAPLTPREPAGVLLRLGAGGKLEVVEAEVSEVAKAPPSLGLFVWPEGEQAERWQVVRSGWKPPQPFDPGAPALAADHTRGGTGLAGAEAAQLTTQLEQFVVTEVPRDLALYTPMPGGRSLSPRPVFRRLPETKGPRFPAAEVVLQSLSPKKDLMTFRFAEGQERIAFADLTGRPKELSDGLPPGKYSARCGPAASEFTVVEQAERDKVLRASDELAGLLNSRTDPLYLQFTIEALLQYEMEYMGDALDLLDSVPEKELTPAMKQQRAIVLRCLMATPEDRKKAFDNVADKADATAVPEIETARKYIVGADWTRAEKALKGAALAEKGKKDPRVAGLTALYLGVILAEAGPTRTEEAEQAFQRALESLKEAPAADRFRAHVNYGNFLLRDAQDRLNNHAMQMAAGVQRPLLTALQTWIAARQQYEVAVPLADKLPASDRAAARLNLARLYALLADAIRVLDRPDADGKRGFVEGENSAAKQADEMAAAAGATEGADTMVRAAAEEIRALVAFRLHDDRAAEAAARRALAIHLEGGRLAGAESVYRVLGLVAKRRNTPEARHEALRHFQVAHRIAEALRERFPPDRAGLSRAGFFARKAYVSEKIVELLLADGRAVEALHYAEQAKARALQDLLAGNKDQLAAKSKSKPDTAPPASLGDLLAKWPAEAAAVEYFLGADEAYVFVIDTKGNVTAHQLRDAAGKPLVPRELIARVRRLLADMEGQSAKLYNRLMSGRGYDNGWQEELHRLYNELLPEAARKGLQGAKVVVVVPQHILHYFPFAALVTKRDEAATPKRMARPRFLLDEGFDLIDAPSLTAWRARPAAAAKQVWAVGLADIPGAPPLEGVKKDLSNLQTTFGERVKGVLEGPEAREAAVKKLLDKPGVLFFGTHGINVADQPLESHLLLHPEENAPPPGPDADDGRLTAAELFARKVAADLVVMSACYSGLGDRSPLPGDDLFGLQRAFLQSGARTVVSGLWDVYDGTAPELMLGFFKGLVGGKPAAAALCASQRAFLEKLRASPRDEPWLHPYFWAVYTTAGDDRTRVE